jgi:hypothetical protein
VTTKERTLIDCCTVMSPAIVMRIAEHWLAQRLTTLDRIHDTIDRLAALTGAQRLARALDERTLGPVVADSTMEEGLGMILVAAGIPPVHHVVVTVASGRTYELDWAYPEAMIGIQVDGYGIHLRSIAAFDDDRWRRKEIENEGWQILDVTDRHLRRSPDQVVEQVQAALTRGLPAA